MRLKKSQAILLVIIVAVSGMLVFFLVGNMAGLWAAAPTTTTTPTTSTFTVISYVDGEDVSDFVPISIWVPEESDSIEEFEDVTYLSTNFEEEVASDDAEDVSEDLSAHSYFWVEIDPDGDTVFANNFHLFSGNGQYTIYVYHQSSDLNFNMLTSTNDEVTMGSYQTNGNFTFIMSVPQSTTTNAHAGSGGWDIEQSDVNDMDATELRELYDERFWRCQAPTYDPAVDTQKKYDDTLERITNAFALMIDFNDTVSTTDGNVNQVNCSITDFYTDYPVEVIISGDKIYFVFTQVIQFKYNDYTLPFEMEFGTNISISDVDSGRIVVPQDDDNLGLFTKYSDIAA